MKNSFSGDISRKKQLLNWQSIGLRNKKAQTSNNALKKRGGTSFDVQIKHANALNTSAPNLDRTGTLGQKKEPEMSRQRDAEDPIKSPLMSWVAHELRTPVNVILGYCSLFRDSGNKMAFSKQREMIDRICHNAGMLLALINDILDLKRIDSDEMRVEAQTISVSEIARQALENLRHFAEEKGLTLLLTDHSNARTIRSDPLKLWQICLNLIENAIKYTDQGSIAVLIYDHPDQEKIAIEILDTGIGITKEDLAQIFKPFYRVETSKGKSEGTGLGLTIVKKLCDLLGGAIHVTSQFGVGSSFIVTLPYDREC